LQLFGASVIRANSRVDASSTGIATSTPSLLDF